MAVGIVDRQKLVNIADAVRAKKGITGNMTLDAIASNITSMPTADNNAKFDFSKNGSSGDLMQHLTTIDLSGWDTSNVTDMAEMFNGCSSLTSLDVSNFNTSKVTDMSGMFSSCKSLTSLDLSNLNTASVTDMNSMFSSCYSLTSLDLSNLNTASVTDMTSMFSSCKSLTSLDLSNLNTASVTHMYLMFSNCTSLTSLDLSNFDTSKVSNMMNIFNTCNSLTTLDLSNWDTSKVTYMGSMFQNCSKLSNLTLGNDWASNSSISSFDLHYSPLTRESAVDVINKLATRSNSPVITFSTDVGLYQPEIDVATNKGWSVSGCTLLMLVDAESATVGQYTLIDGVMSKCVYVADTPQDWGQKLFVGPMLYVGDTYMHQWGGSGTVTGITETAIGTGLTNTNALLAMNLQSTNGTPTIWGAIKEFRNTHSDRWFIASRGEGVEAKKNGLDDVWTSSEYDANEAYMTFDYGSKYTHTSKTSGYRAFAFTYV